MYRMITTIIIIVSYIECSNFDRIVSSSHIVNTKYGMLMGNLVRLSSQLKSTKSEILSNLPDVETYLGIPYATSPTGGLRFMPPVTPTHWQGVRSVTKPTPVCPQHIPRQYYDALRSRSNVINHERLQYLRRLIPLLRNQSEDCLHLNIYVPILSNVVVVIHGESYDWSTGMVFDGSILAAVGRVIVVTLNYRLGLLGFLPSFADGNVRGNYGLMDQVAALHWIQENINEFGGAASNVTIVGHGGRGSACAHLLMLSPMAKGLFTRVVLMDGSANSPWAIVSLPEYWTKKLGHQLNCTNLESMIECLRDRKVDDLFLSQAQLSVPDHLTAFGPIVDSIVIPYDPRTLDQTNKVPMTNSMTSTIIGQQSYDLLLGLMDHRHYRGNCQFTDLEINDGIDSERRDRILRTLVQNLFDYQQHSIYLTLLNEYSDWSISDRPSKAILESTVSILADSLILAPMVRTASQHSLKNRHQPNMKRTYFYKLNPNISKDDTTISCSNDHSLAYLFGDPIVQFVTDGKINLGPFHYGTTLTNDHQLVSINFMKYFINFINTGDPNLGPMKPIKKIGQSFWPMYEPHRTFLSIGPGSSAKPIDHDRNHRLSLWLSLIPKLLNQKNEPIGHNWLNMDKNNDYISNRKSINQQLNLESINSLPYHHTNVRQPNMSEIINNNKLKLQQTFNIKMKNVSTIGNSLPSSSPSPPPPLATTSNNNDKSIIATGNDERNHLMESPNISSKFHNLLFDRRQQHDRRHHHQQQQNWWLNSPQSTTTMLIGSGLLIVNVAIFVILCYQLVRTKRRMPSNGQSNETNRY
ncbi:postsynaptic membrane assembly [Blomia tropicalis]|nr:postsynaptic membrane assembly [Blomia tropicalis]